MAHHDDSTYQEADKLQVVPVVPQRRDVHLQQQPRVRSCVPTNVLVSPERFQNETPQS